MKETESTAVATAKSLDLNKELENIEELFMDEFMDDDDDAFKDLLC